MFKALGKIGPKMGLMFRALSKGTTMKKMAALSRTKEKVRKKMTYVDADGVRMEISVTESQVTVSEEESSETLDFNGLTEKELEMAPKHRERQRELAKRERMKKEGLAGKLLVCCMQAQDVADRVENRLKKKVYVEEEVEVEEVDLEEVHKRHHEQTLNDIRLRKERQELYEMTLRERESTNGIPSLPMSKAFGMAPGDAKNGKKKKKTVTVVDPKDADSKSKKHDKNDPQQVDDEKSDQDAKKAKKKKKKKKHKKRKVKKALKDNNVPEAKKGPESKVGSTTEDKDTAADTAPKTDDSVEDEPSGTNDTQGPDGAAARSSCETSNCTIM